jgi:thiol:disulfide interchange protein DsbC
MLFLLFFSFSAHALEVSPALQKSLEAMLGKEGAAKIELNESPLPGLYEAVIDSYIFYVSQDGHYIVRDAEILDMQSGGKNLTEARKNGLNLKTLEALKDKEQIIFKAKGETKHVLRVFTDVDCFYCAKLHREVPELNEAGIEVRYMAFPRAGLKSETYNTMQSVWCADDQQQALTNAKSGKAVPAKSCDNPIAAHYALGQKMGVNGTPALVMPDGQLFPGYAPAKKLIQFLNEAK